VLTCAACGAPVAAQWVAVSERKPDRGALVLIRWGNSPRRAVAKFGGKRWIDPNAFEPRYAEFRPPTHWTALPC
jgi:hypothetical protein